MTGEEKSSTDNFCMAVPATGLESGSSLLDGAIVITGVSHLGKEQTFVVGEKPHQLCRDYDSRLPLESWYNASFIIF